MRRYIELENYIVDFQREHKRSPSNKEIMESLLLSPVRLSQLFKFLEKKGRLIRTKEIKILHR